MRWPPICSAGCRPCRPRPIPSRRRSATCPRRSACRNVGKHGRYLLKIYSQANIWDMAGMEQFVKQVRSVDQQATGNPLQVYEASRQMKRSFEQAAWYALFAIIPFVFLDFRRLSHSLLAVLPMGIGLLQTLGLMGLLDIPLNPANMIVLPLTLGIGMEDGVNIMHDFRSQGRKYRYVSGSTIVAVVVNSLTTMVGFGALMIANHQGLQSLGRVLTISMACNMFNSLMLPNMLAPHCAYLRKREKSEAEAAPDAAFARRGRSLPAQRGVKHAAHAVCRPLQDALSRPPAFNPGTRAGRCRRDGSPAPRCLRRQPRRAPRQPAALPWAERLPLRGEVRATTHPTWRFRLCLLTPLRPFRAWFSSRARGGLCRAGRCPGADGRPPCIQAGAAEHAVPPLQGRSHLLGRDAVECKPPRTRRCHRRANAGGRRESCPSPAINAPHSSC